MDDEQESASGTVFRDIIFLSLAAFVIIIVLMLPFINENKKEVMSTASSLAVEVNWSQEKDIDVDTWILTPEDEPVGYSRKSGLHASLLRDDRGYINDSSGINYEVMFLRTLPDGEYVLNLHVYTIRSDLPVTCTVKITQLTNNTNQVISTRFITLTYLHEEITVERFNVIDGRIILTKPTVQLDIRPN